MKVQIDADKLSFDALPDGKYHVIFTDGEVRQTGDDSKHPNNDYWNAEFTVQDGPLAGKKDWCNIMLPPYELYTLGNILVAAGYDKDDISNGKVDVELFDDLLDDPEDDMSVAIVGLEMCVTIKTKTKDGKENRNQRFFAYDPDTWDSEEGVDLQP